MTDQELLELASKAVGLHEDWPAPDYGAQWNGDGIWCFGNGEGELWNPLADDGDALRLAVKLNLHISIDAESAGVVTVEWTFDSGGFAINEIQQEAPVGGDDYAATRRAIVRAAAEIGNAKAAT